VLGDHEYGGGKASTFGETILTRRMLHAETLLLLHPDNRNPMTFSAPPPQDMSKVINGLRYTMKP
jgi:23S rRNA-/tRNA-specific pseudouridylate synthase